MTERRIAEGHPGSSCPKGYLATTTELSDEPICTASREYQKAKLRALGFDAPPPADSDDPRVKAIYVKTCICDHLGNGALVDLGIAHRDLPVAVCPGPNIAHFDRLYSLREMVDHIYGRGPSLIPASREHMLAKELEMYLDHLEARVGDMARGDARTRARLEETRANLERGLAHYRELVRLHPYPGENIDSLRSATETQAQRLARIAHAMHESRSEAPTTA